MKPGKNIDVDYIIKYIIKNKLDAVACIDPINAAYITGKYDKVHIPLNPRELGTVPVFFKDGSYDAGTAWTLSDTLEMFVRFVQKKIGENCRIGMDTEYMSVEAFNILKSFLPGTEIISADILFHFLRARKTPLELDLINKGVRAMDRSIYKVLSVWRNGTKISDIADVFSKSMIDEGGMFIGSYINSFCKSWHDEESLYEFDMARKDRSQYYYYQKDCTIEYDHEFEVDMDLNGWYEGYCTDYACAVYLGCPPVHILKQYEYKREAQALMVEKIKPYITAGEAYISIKEALTKDIGYHGFWMFHGVGLKVHEQPLLGSPIQEGTDIPLCPGTVLAVETGKGVEDLYVMSEDRLRRMNSLPQELIIVK